jgi:3',5'-cyclic AMP phosphodiesterase CpdA
MRKVITLCRLLGLVILWFACATLVEAADPAGNDTLTFVHITDVHICNLTGYHQAFVQKRQQFGSGINTFPGFLKTLPEKVDADFVVVTGDNIDYYEAETEKGGMLDTQIEQYSRLLDNCKLPVYLTLGNHDIASYRITPGPWTGNNQLQAGKARAAWMRNVSCFKDGTYYSQLYKVDTTTFRLIFLDNAYYSTPEISDGELSFSVDPFQLKWLDDQMNTSPSDIEIIFMHLPLPQGKPADDKILTEATSIYSSKTELFNLFSVVEKNSSSTLIFAGHNHINDINRYILPDGDILTQVRTGALGYEANNWRVIKITKNKILICQPGSTKTEYTITLN